MHWMRIDRYFTSSMNEEVAEKEGVGAIDKFLKMEVPSTDDSLEVVFQPVMCQHCNQAPCETVCPVLATTHSLEGLNQMTYNRCIGTRYCANNCPYKVRRFNWFRYNENEAFDFNMYDDMGKMVLNPDVTVRSRGVMEKCSMCVQRIQAGKLSAKKKSERPADGSIKTACQQACPTNAITFGDFNDQNSAVRKAWNDERKYQLLEEVGTQPSVYYLTKVRNKPATTKA
jgi:molybdopterin-containing oxidoreductase family iron-sulfur binding subunit